MLYMPKQHAELINSRKKMKVDYWTNKFWVDKYFKIVCWFVVFLFNFKHALSQK